MEARVEDLASRMSTDELISRLRSSAVSPSISSVGLPELTYRVEAIHGLEAYCMRADGGKLVCPTYFPICQGMQASFNRTVFHNFGRVVGIESRVWTNRGGKAKSKKVMGPSIRSPMVNILRDPRVSARWSCFPSE